MTLWGTDTFTCAPGYSPPGSVLRPWLLLCKRPGLSLNFGAVAGLDTPQRSALALGPCSPLARSEMERPAVCQPVIMPVQKGDAHLRDEAIGVTNWEQMNAFADTWLLWEQRENPT